MVFVVVAGIFQSCYSDRSTLDLNPISGVNIDTTDMVNFSVYQFDFLKVIPKLQMGSLKDTDLIYEWKINLVPDDTLYQIISNDRNLDYEVKFKPNTSGKTHQLYYTVTDKNTGLDYIMTWPVTVLNNIGEGLIIAETYDGNSTEISHIMSPEVTTGFNDVSVKYEVFSSLNNGIRIDGLIKDMRFTKIYGVDALLGITDTDIYRINTIDYTLGGKNNDLFFTSKATYLPQSLGGVRQNDLLIEGGKLTATFLGASTKFGLPFDSQFTVPTYVASNPFTYNPLPIILSFYDEVNGHFVYQPSFNSWGDRNMYVTPSVIDGPFNPSELPNKINLAASVSTEGEFRHLLKDQNSSAVEIFILDSGQDNYPTVIAPAPKSVYDISNAPDIQNASHFVFLDNQRIMYYASGSKIYAVLYAGTTPVIEHRYTIPDGAEITTMQVFQQADYPYKSDPNQYLASNNKQLIVSTYGSEGTVYLLPFVNVGIGNINKANIRKFTGFGRISAITTQL